MHNLILLTQHCSDSLALLLSAPMQATMLGRYNITVREEVLKQLEDGPQAWKALKKRMLQR